MRYYSAIKRNTFESVPIRWMNLEPIIREGNGTPRQYSCLENSMDGGAWKAAVHEVAEGRTGLKQLSAAA